MFISVIVPVYNVEKYLDKCLESLLNQHYSDMEIVVVDDKSTDGSLNIAKKYEKHTNVKVVAKEKNSGLSDTRNVGIKESCGQYIMFLDSDDYVENGFSKYTKGYDYHKVVKMHLDKICNMIIEAGGKAISLVDSNALPERYIAYLAGVGFIGKNNMIITKTYGSYVFLGEIITDLNLYDDDVRKFDEISKFKECGECTICYKECPTKAINEYKKNPNICTSYITQKKELTDIEIKLLKDKIFGCDVCQNKCPYNENISFSKIKEFKPLEFMENGKYEVYAEINNKAFKEKILPTSCGWRGKNIIKRNAIIKLHNRGGNIEKYKGDSPYLNKYIEILNK